MFEDVWIFIQLSKTLFRCPDGGKCGERRATGLWQGWLAASPSLVEFSFCTKGESPPLPGISDARLNLFWSLFSSCNGSCIPMCYFSSLGRSTKSLLLVLCQKRSWTSGIVVARTDCQEDNGGRFAWVEQGRYFSIGVFSMSLVDCLERQGGTVWRSR